jgi:hypothetical protein
VSIAIASGARLGGVDRILQRLVELEVRTLARLKQLKVRVIVID